MPYTQEWHVVYDAYRHPPLLEDKEGGDPWEPRRAVMRERFFPPPKPKPTWHPFVGDPVLYHVPDQMEPLKRLGCLPTWYNSDRKAVADAHLDLTHPIHRLPLHAYPHYWY